MNYRTRNRVAEYPVSMEYIDSNLNKWEYKAYVQVSHDGEVQGCRLECLEGFDTGDNPISTKDNLTQSIIDGIKEQAGRRAIEKMDEEDFNGDY